MDRKSSSTKINPYTGKQLNAYVHAHEFALALACSCSGELINPWRMCEEIKEQATEINHRGFFEWQ